MSTTFRSLVLLQHLPHSSSAFLGVAQRALDPAASKTQALRTPGRVAELLHHVVRNPNAPRHRNRFARVQQLWGKFTKGCAWDFALLGILRVLDAASGRVRFTNYNVQIAENDPSRELPSTASAHHVAIAMPRHYVLARVKTRSQPCRLDPPRAKALFSAALLTPFWFRTTVRG